MNSSDPEWETGRLLLGDFEVQRVLGQGGMGKVYLVRSRTTGMEFAVKRAHLKDENNRQNFLGELKTWIDLTEHPNIAACRFFRAVGDEMVIFSEYIAGGTLSEWIRSRRLKTLEQILDVAIQFAWGLHAIHEHGLIHQDVKPGNVLMTSDGVAKVTDFGLARARAATTTEHLPGAVSPSERSSLLVSVAGMTPEYCSPEQASGKRLARQTDIWSWGVAVLDMFYGTVSCRYGQAAGAALEAYFEPGLADEELPRMPPKITILLGKCFLRDPSHRWQSTLEIAETLVGLHLELTGTPYSRPVPSFSRSAKTPIPAADRRRAVGHEWKDPRIWLVEALKAAGRDTSELEVFVPLKDAQQTRKALAIAELTLYEQAREIFESLISAGRLELNPTLAHLLTDASAVYQFAGDLHGALFLHERTINIWESEYMRDRGMGQANLLAMAYLNTASVMGQLNDTRGALECNSKAVDIWECLIREAHTRPEIRRLAKELVTSGYTNMANAACHLGDRLGAIALYNKAIEIQQQSVSENGRWEDASSLALMFTNKALVTKELHGNNGALSLHEKAIEIRERLVHREGHEEIANELACAYANKANDLMRGGDFLAAMSLCDKAIEIRERLIQQEGRWELAHDLALAYLTKAKAAGDFGDCLAAVALYDRAIEIWERLVYIEGSTTLMGDLAGARALQASPLIKLGQQERGLRQLREAKTILESEILRTSRSDLKNILDWLNIPLDDYSP